MVDVVSGCAANLEQVELTTDDVSSDDEEGGGREVQVMFPLSGSRNAGSDVDICR